MLEAIREGLTDAGWILIPLVLASFFGWYLVFRRYFVLTGMQWSGYRVWKRSLEEKNWESSITRLSHRDRRSAAGQALFAVFSAREGTRKDMENRLDEVMKRIIPELEKNLSTLAVLAAAAPLMGLLGTVDGIIHTFKVISVFGTGNTALMSDSISEALLATQNGLLCAFPLMVMQVLLANRADAIEREAQAAGATLINKIAGAT